MLYHELAQLRKGLTGLVLAPQCMEWMKTSLNAA